MKRPKNFLFLVLLLSVVAVVLAAVVHSARVPRPAGPAPASAQTGIVSQTPNPVSDTARAAGTPSAAARRRAKEFNDATSRFNSPDDQQH